MKEIGIISEPFDRRTNMPTAKERLKYFLALADQGPAQCVALAEEIIDFLIDWPSECPQRLRHCVMELLDMTLQEADDFTRTRLAARLNQVSDLPLSLANRMFHCAPKSIQHEILNRNEAERNSAKPQPIRDPVRLVAAARAGMGDNFAVQFAQAMHISPGCANAILADDSGQSLAALCKGTRMNRGFFSALAVLIFAGRPTDPARLTAYEEISQIAAENMAAFWQTQNRRATAA